MVLKIDIIPLKKGEPQQESIYFEGHIIIKKGCLVGNVDEIMEEYYPHASLFCPKEVGKSEKDFGTIHFDIQKFDNSVDEVVIAHCNAYLLNERGKTVDHFTCR